jgi:hypothetical protein
MTGSIGFNPKSEQGGGFALTFPLIDRRLVSTSAAQTSKGRKRLHLLLKFCYN